LLKDTQTYLIDFSHADTREDTSSENCDDASSLATSTVSATDVVRDGIPAPDSTADQRASSAHPLEELCTAYDDLVQQANVYRGWKARFNDVQSRFEAARAAEPKVWSLVGLLGMEREAVLLEQKNSNLSFKDDQDIHVRYAALRQQLESLCAGLAEREAWEGLYKAGTLLESWAASV